MNALKVRIGEVELVMPVDAIYSSVDLLLDAVSKGKPVSIETITLSIED